MDSGKDIPWSDLPKELVEKIGKCLHTHIDVLRFRAACTTWRSSLPPFKSFPTFPLKLPLKSCPERSPYNCNARKQPNLIESTVYLFQPPDSASSASPSSRGWLVKVAPTIDGKFKIMNPVTDNLVNVCIDPPRDEVIKVLPHNMPKVLNLLDFRVSQVCKSYHVQDTYYSCNDCYKYNNYSKILISSNHAWNETTNLFSLMAIDNSGQLSYLKSGDEYWTMLEGDDYCNVVDIIVYKGNFYAVDRYGKTIQFDSSFNETIVSSILCNGGTSRKKRLVESCAQLYLVDIVLDDDEHRCPLRDKALEIKIYRLHEEQHEWIGVHTLGDQIFFAGDDCCFSVSSHDFGGCRGNCIYFSNRGTVIGKYVNQHFRYDPKSFGPIVGDADKFYRSFRCMNEGDGKPGSLSKELVRRYTGLHHRTGVFTLEDGKIGSVLFSPEYADIFWPPPSWLNQARSDALDAIHSASSKLLAVADCIANSRSPNPLASHMSNGPLMYEKVEAPFDPEKELSRLVVEHKYEEAFTAALQRNDVSILAWLCSQVDLRDILSTKPLPLTQGVLLSLLQRLVTDIRNETSQKLSCLMDVLSAINSSSSELGTKT